MIRPPKHLSASSKKLYREIATDYGLEHDGAALAVLKLACESLDLAETARLELARDGTTVVTSAGTLKTHPAAAVLRDAKIAAIRALRELSLEGSEPAPDGRRMPKISTGPLT